MFELQPIEQIALPINLTTSLYQGSVIYESGYFDLWGAIALSSIGFVAMFAITRIVAVIIARKCDKSYNNQSD